jgi:hypothetical protein
MEIIQLPIFCLKHNGSETGFYLRLHVEPTQLGPINTASLRNVVFQIKDRMMDNVQNCDNYINIPASQTYR